MRWARWWLIASCHGAEVVTVDDGPAVVAVDDAAVVVVVDERIIAVVVTEGALHLPRAHGAAVVSHLPEGQGSRSRPTCAVSARVSAGRASSGRMSSGGAGDIRRWCRGGSGS